MDFIDKDGNKITIEQWGALFDDPAYRLLAEDETALGTVKTMWHGYHNEMTGHSLFGTALIDLKRGNIWEVATYQNQADALDGHARLVADLSSLKPGGPGEWHGEADDDS